MDAGRPIVLIGFMATGKTTVGRLVAERTGRRFVDLDQLVEETAGMTIADLFRSAGEPAFRRAEAQALRRAGVSFDLHIYEHGQHGMGLGTHDYNPAKWHPWTKDCVFWLKSHGFANKSE